MKIIKLAAAFLAGFMLLTVIAGCTNPDAGKNDVTTLAAGSDPTVATSAPETNLADALPVNIDYQGHVFTVLTRGTDWKCRDFASEEVTGDLVDDAFFKRSSAVERLFNIDIVNQYCEGIESTSQMMKTITLNQSSGDALYDLALGGLLELQSPGRSGYLYNMLDLPGLTLTNGCWDPNCIKELTVKNYLFTVTGDATISPFETSFCVFFSKTVAADKQITGLYDLVADGSWTIERMVGFASDIHDELDGDNIPTSKDRYGILHTWDSILAHMGGSDIGIASVNNGGELELTFGSDHVYDVFENYFTWSYSACSYNPYVEDKEADFRYMFMNNQSLFLITYLTVATKFRQEMETEYGILPYPKYDAEQKNYGTFIHSYGCSSFSVPANAPDAERTGNILEALGVFSNMYLTPAYYEETMMSKNAKDPQSQISLEIIRDTRVYDAGVVFKLAGFKDVLLSLVKTHSSNVSSTFKASRSKLVRDISDINKDFEAFAEKQ